MPGIDVMIATDGSDAAIEAAQRAVGLLHPDARVKLVTVVDAWHDPAEDAGGFEGPVFTEEQADDEYRHQLAEGRAALDRTSEALGARVTEQELLPSAAPVHEALRELVEAEQPDLLVLGSEQPGWFQRFLHGSIEDQLLHHVSCPLLIVGHRPGEPRA